MPELAKSNRTDIAAGPLGLAAASIGCVALLTLGGPTASTTWIAAQSSYGRSVADGGLRAQPGAANSTEQTEIRGAKVSGSWKITSSDAHEVPALELGKMVREFCGRHPEVLPILEAAPRMVAEAFGDDHSLAAELVTDPAFGTEQVYLVVRTLLSPKDADARQFQLEDDWWLEAMASAPEHVGLSIEFA